MTRYDVVIVGAGPAGCYAAKTAAESGAKVLILEEHATVGSPCHDTGWLIGTGFTERILKTLRGRVISRRMKRFKVFEALTGAVLEDIGGQKLGHLTPRADFDKELAKLALKAGAELLLNARVTSLLRKGGKAKGVITASKNAPKVESKVTVCASGAATLSSPLAMADSKGQLLPGVLMELTGTEGFEGGVVEVYKTQNPKLLPDMFFWPHSKDTCFVGFPSMDKFKEFKSREEIAFSRKIRRAYPVQTSGYVSNLYGGRVFEKIYDDGVLYVGEAAGVSGTIHGMIMGHYAGMVAAKAAHEGFTGSKRLSEYQEIFRASSICRAPFYWLFVKEHYGSYRRCLDEFKKIRL